MAIYLRSNVVELLRASGCPYWKIYENERTRASGNFVIAADLSNPDLAIEASCQDLTQKLSRLSQGRYLLTAYDKMGSKKSGVDSTIELEAIGGSPISGIGSTDGAFHMDGIGKVTAENFEASIEKKMQMMLDKQKAEKELQDLKRENTELKRGARESDSGYRKGVMAIGTVAYTALSKTPQFKEIMDVVGSVLKMSTAAPGAAGESSVTEDTDAVILPENHTEGESAEIGGVRVNQDRLFAALDKLGKDNPDVLSHIEGLANLKETDPDMYQAGLDFMKPS